MYDYTLFDRLVTKYVEVSLLDEPFYTTQFNIDSVAINMQVGYDTRKKLRWIILTSNTGVVLLKQTYIKHGRRCELNFNSNLYNLDYYVTVVPKKRGESLEDADYLNWKDTMNICFVGFRYELTEQLEKNYRINRVGN